LERRRGHHQLRNDDELTLSASIDWFGESSFAVDAVQVESLDFGALLGDVVPRDGLQRPVLTSGSPMRARAGRRAAAQPIHVTYVHQMSFRRVLLWPLQLRPQLPRARPACRIWNELCTCLPVPSTPRRRSGNTGVRRWWQRECKHTCMMTPCSVAACCHFHCPTSPPHRTHGQSPCSGSSTFPTRVWCRSHHDLPPARSVRLMRLRASHH
jgi:hypothetical protein